MYILIIVIPLINYTKSSLQFLKIVIPKSISKYINKDRNKYKSISKILKYFSSIFHIEKCIQYVAVNYCIIYRDWLLFKIYVLKVLLFQTMMMYDESGGDSYKRFSYSELLLLKRYCWLCAYYFTLALS